MVTPTDNGVSAIGQVQALLNTRFTHDPFVPARVAMESAPGNGNNETSLSQLFTAIYHSISEDIAHLNREVAQAHGGGGEAGIRATISELHHLQGSIQNHMQEVGRAGGGAGMAADIAAKTVIRRHAGIMEDVRGYLVKRGAPIQASGEAEAGKTVRHMSPVELQWHNMSRLSLETDHAAARTAVDIQDYAMALKLAQTGDEVTLKTAQAALKKALAQSEKSGLKSEIPLETRARRVLQAAKHMQQRPEEAATVFMQLVGKDAEELLSRTQALATLQGNALTRAIEVGFEARPDHVQLNASGSITAVPQGFSTTGLMPMDDSAKVQQLLRQLNFVKHRMQHAEPDEIQGRNIMPAEATKIVPLFNLVEGLARSASNAAPFHAHVNEEAPLADMTLANVDAARMAFSNVMQGLHDHASKRCKQCSSLKGKMGVETPDTSFGYRALNRTRPLEHAEAIAHAVNALDQRANELGIGKTQTSSARFV